MSEPVSKAAIEFGRRIRDERNLLGATQEEVGADAGIDPTTVGKIERGERNTTLHNILRLAATLGIDPGELVTGIGIESVPKVQRGLSAEDRMKALRARREGS